MKSPLPVLLLLAALTGGGLLPGAAWAQEDIEDMDIEDMDIEDLSVAEQQDAPVSPELSFHLPKSHATAYGLMLASTVVPVVAALAMPGNEASVVLAVGGLMIGPSAGQFYAGSGAKGVAGVGIRLLGVPVGLLVGGIMAGGANDEPFADLAAFLGGMMIGTGVMWIIGTTYSLIDTPRAVDRANERARGDFLSRASLSPLLYPIRDGHNVTGWAPGLAFNASF